MEMVNKKGMNPKTWLVLAAGVILLSACGVMQTPRPLPTVVLQNNSSAIDQSTPSTNESGAYTAASGVLVSDHQSELAFLTSGNVKQVNVAVGQEVKTGDLLSELDNTILQIQLDQVNLVLAELTSPSAISNAQKAVADDQANYNAALGTYSWWKDLQSQSQDLLKKANADMVVAQSAVKDALDDYNKYYEDAYSDKDKALAYQKLYDAQQKVDGIQKRINLYTSVDPVQMAKYKADVDVAKVKLANDQTLLAALTGAALPDNPSGDGYAQLIQARMNLQLAQANLQNSKMISPIDGNVSKINISVGSFVQAGQIQIVVTDPLHLHVETTDLSERDVTNVKVGQAVSVTIKAINQQVKGKVTAVSPLADTLGGDVVYKAFIQLDDLPEGSLPGMTITVDFLAK
jgi:multidrug efflux pump subunit AcrA (membrane-fusion protein)